MAKVSFDIPEKLIEEASKKKIKDLQKQIKSLEGKNARLQLKVDSYVAEEQLEKRSFNKIRDFVESLRYEGTYDSLFECQNCRYPY